MNPLRLACLLVALAITLVFAWLAQTRGPAEPEGDVLSIVLVAGFVVFVTWIVLKAVNR